VSGGSWAAVPYTFLPQAYNEEKFIGFPDKVVGPEELRNKDLAKSELGSLCEAISNTTIFDHLLKNWIKLRGYHRILKLARSIADLQGSTNISELHLGQAIPLRSLDR
jgi:predicted ATPase with chaperone activity